MRRLYDWESRLFELIERKRWLDFDWGNHDCCTFAAAAVEAVSGQHIELPGPYISAKEALRAVRDLGGLPAAVSAALGQEPKSPFYAQRGDIVLLSQPGAFDGHALAVCMGEYAYAPGEENLVPIQMNSPAIVAAWHIGHADPEN